jgi:hypothetical protein
VFAYFSDRFIRQLVSPHYRVEMTRRMRSLAEMDALRIARLAAQAEGKSAQSIEELIAEGLLPDRFGRRVDGSRLVEAEGQLVDSLRGRPGSFVPIPDVPVTAVTAAEQVAYRRFGEIYVNDWKRIDPIIAAVRRTPLDQPGRERLTIEVVMTPYHRGTYGFATLLGPPTTSARAPIAGDVASLDVVMSGRLVAQLTGQPVQPVHAFAALRDFRFPFTIQQGRVVPNNAPVNLARGYLGVYPKPNILDRFVGGPEELVFDDEGYAPPAEDAMIDDCWQRRFAEWGVISFQRDVLAEVTPQLSMTDRQRPAQVRLRVEDLRDKAICEFVNALGYQQARLASASGSRFMNSLARQLRVPPAECRATAETLVGGTFRCPLGGNYALLEPTGGHPVWVSDALAPNNRFLFSEVPSDFTLPLLTWFRGVTAELSLTEDTLTAYAVIDLEHKTGSASKKASDPKPLALPDFGLGGRKNGSAETEREPVPPEAEELPPPR